LARTACRCQRTLWLRGKMFTRWGREAGAAATDAPTTSAHPKRVAAAAAAPPQVPETPGVPSVVVFDAKWVRQVRVPSAGAPGTQTMAALAADCGKAMRVPAESLLLLHPNAPGCGVDGGTAVPGGVYSGSPPFAFNLAPRPAAERVAEDLEKRWSSLEESDPSSCDSDFAFEIVADDPLKPMLQQRSAMDLELLKQAARCTRAYLRERTDELHMMETKLVRVSAVLGERLASASAQLNMLIGDTSIKDATSTDLDSFEEVAVDSTILVEFRDIEATTKDTLAKASEVLAMYRDTHSGLDRVVARVAGRQLAPEARDSLHHLTITAAVDEAKGLLDMISWVTQVFDTVETTRSAIAVALQRGNEAVARLEDHMQRAAEIVKSRPDLSVSVLVLETQKSDLEVTVSNLTEAVECRKEQLQALKAMHTERLQDLASVELSLAEIQSLQKAAVVENEAARSASDRLKRTEIESARLKAECAAYKAKVVDLQSAHQELQGQNVDLVKRLATAEERIESNVVAAESAATSVDLASMREETDALKEEQKKIRLEKMELYDAIKRAKAVAGTHAELRAQIASLESRNMALECTLREERERARSPPTVGGGDRSSVSAGVTPKEQHALTRNDMALRRESDLKSKISDLESEKYAMRLELLNLNNTIEGLRRTCDAATDGAARSEVRLTDKMEECDRLLNRIQELERGIHQGADDMAALQATISDLYHRCDVTVANVAQDVNSGDARINSLVLLQWSGANGKWNVANAPHLRLAPGIEDQLVLDKTRVHLVRVVLRDGNSVAVSRV